MVYSAHRVTFLHTRRYFNHLFLNITRFFSSPFLVLLGAAEKQTKQDESKALIFEQSVSDLANRLISENMPLITKA